MRKKKMFLAVLLLGAVFISGCIFAAVGVGAGTAVYAMGDLKSTEAKDINTVYNAVEKTIDQLSLKTIEKSHDEMSGKLIARDSQDKKLTIKLKAVSEKVTSISIRVGFFGDETKTRLIYEKIQENLK